MDAIENGGKKISIQEELQYDGQVETKNEAVNRQKLETR